MKSARLVGFSDLRLMYKSRAENMAKEEMFRRTRYMFFQYRSKMYGKEDKPGRARRKNNECLRAAAIDVKREIDGTCKEKKQRKTNGTKRKSAVQKNVIYGEKNKRQRT